MNLFVFVLVFAVFLLSGGFLYCNALLTMRVQRSQAFYVATTPFFVTVVCVWLLGGYLIRDSLRHHFERKGLAELLIGFFLLFAGMVFLNALTIGRR
jgi:hypothetical protein